MRCGYIAAGAAGSEIFAGAVSRPLMHLAPAKGTKERGRRDRSKYGARFRFYATVSTVFVNKRK